MRNGRAAGSSLRTALACAAVASALAPGSGQAEDEADRYRSLIDNSPFLTPAFKARIGQRDTGALRFVGYTRIGGEWQFAVSDTKANVGYWLKQNEEQNGLKVERFDEKTETIHLTIAGIGVDLSLQR